MFSSLTTLLLGSLITHAIGSESQETIPTHERSYYCVDCHTLKVHYSSPTVLEESSFLVNCSSTDHPYCDSSTSSCSLTPTPACAPNDTFPCISDGFFPDPLDCRVFHLCVNLTSTRYTCDSSQYPTYTYDVVSHKCVQSSKCGYKCASKSGLKVPHPGDNNLFALCVNGNAVLQDRCPGNYEMDEASQKCIAVCRTPGVQPDVHHCRNYFKCFKEDGHLMKTHEHCPEGQAFNPILLNCDNNLSFCNEHSNKSRSNGITSTVTSDAVPSTYKLRYFPIDTNDYYDDLKTQDELLKLGAQ